jgi:putative transcriptional regulator
MVVDAHHEDRMRSHRHVPTSNAGSTNPSDPGSVRAAPNLGRQVLWGLAGVLILALTLGFATTAARTMQNEKNEDEGLFLVARRGLSDPLFKESVVLMLPKDETPRVVGLIVNKPARVQLRDLFPKSHSLQQEDTTAYFGGPVEVGTRGAIFRSTTTPKNAISVFADIYVTFESSALTALADGSQHASAVRIFLGRSQWSTTQLQNEIADRAWFTFRGNADLIFSSHPEAVWRTLLKELEPQPLVQYGPPLIAIPPRDIPTRNCCS